MGGHWEGGGRDGGGDGVVGVHTLSVAIGHQGGEDAEAGVQEGVIAGAQAGIVNAREDLTHLRSSRTDPPPHERNDGLFGLGAQASFVG